MSSFDIENYKDGEYLFKAGDPANKFFVIKTGKVKILDASLKSTIATLQPGESFGEQSLIESGIRGATAQADGQTSCLEITATGLKDLLAKHGGIIQPVLEALLLQMHMHNMLKIK